MQTMYAQRINFIISLILIFILGQSAFANPADDRISQRIAESLEIMEYSYPGQKVFLHLDKDEYLAGESLWFHAYVVNATTLRPDTLSTNFHVELINAHDELAALLFMRLSKGFAEGEISLPDSLAEGSYRIKAYTDWMRNFDEELFFWKDIHISNPIEENFIKRRDVWKNRLFNRRLQNDRESMQFAFFPEGGHLLAGHENRVAFKAADELGGPVDANGVLLDENGNEVLAFSAVHGGMGDFEFTPEPGAEYSARVAFENGEESTYSLPAVQQTGYLLSAGKADDHIHVNVNASIADRPGAPGNSVYLLVHTRGRKVFLEHHALDEDGLSMTVPLNELPTGISQIVLFSDQGDPVAERLVFVNHGDIHEAEILHLETQDEGTEEQTLTVELSGEEVLSGGGYSLAVLDINDQSYDHMRANIASSLLLTSDIGETIKDPWYYLHSTSDEVKRAADLLMLTHGWRRYDWEDIMERSFPEITYGFPEGISIEGVVSPRSSERNTGEVEVELAIHSDGVDVYSITTDERGQFSFTNLDYEDEFTAKLRIDQFVRARDLRVDIDFRDADEIEYSNNLHTEPFSVTSRGDDWERTPRPETMFTSRPLVEPSRESVSMYSDVDQVVYFDDVRDQHNTVMDVLRTRVRGLRLVGNEIVLRGQSSFQLSNEPLFLVDEVVVNRSAFLGISVYNIDRLEVMTGPSTAILGSRGANGALLIYTKRGDHHRHGRYEYSLQGFHVPSETFESKIHTDKFVRHDISRTLFWEANAAPDENNPISATFPVDGHVRNMRLVIQGIGENGEILFSDMPLGGE